MNELLVNLDYINPLDFLGANNQRLHFIKNKFPQIKILSRGTQLKLAGDKEEVEYLKKKIDYVITQIERGQHLSDEEFTEVFHSPEISIPSSSAIDGRLTHFLDEADPDTILYKPDRKPVIAKTPGQKTMLSLCEKNDILFATGPAGTGKTYTAVAIALRALKRKVIRKIILTRPAVEAGENLGYLPGDLKEKIDPYLRPLYDALEDMLPAEKVSQYINTKVIEVAPLAYMRGRTLDNAFLILDEAQNATEMQLKMFLTRIGSSAKVIITGDLSQIDLPHHHKSGLKATIEKLINIDGIASVNLDSKDNLRHKLVTKILLALAKKDKDSSPSS